MQQVSTALRAQGLTVGTPTSGSDAAPGQRHRPHRVRRLRHPARVRAPPRPRHLHGEHGRTRDPVGVGQAITGIVGLSGLSQAALHAASDARAEPGSGTRAAITVGAPRWSRPPPRPRRAVAPRPVQPRRRGGERRRLHVDAVGRRLRTEPAVRARVARASGRPSPSSSSSSSPAPTSRPSRRVTA